jgi:hypothetical protein
MFWGYPRSENVMGECVWEKVYGRIVGSVSLCVKESVCLFVFPLLCFGVPPSSWVAVSLSVGVWALCLLSCSGAFPFVLRSVRLGSSMSASSSVSLSLCSHSRSFGAAVRLLSQVSLSGSVSVSVCSYGSGTAYVDFVPLPSVVPVWPAIVSLAFSGFDGDGLLFVANWSLDSCNARASALESLLSAIDLEISVLG